MLHRLRVALVICLTATAGFASDPPPLPDPLPPPALPAPYIQPVEPPQTTFTTPVPVTIENILRSSLSPTVANALAESLQRTAKSSGVDSEEIDTPFQMPTRQGLHISADVQSYPSFLPQPYTLAGSRVMDCCSDTLADRETAIITNPIGGVYYTYSAFMSYDYNPTVLKWRVRTTPGGGIQPKAVHNTTGDPVLAVNPYDLGVAPHRTYLAAIDFDDNANKAPSQLDVWWADNGAAFIPSADPIVLHSEPIETPQYVIDKPSIAVSNNYNSLGWIYVVAMRALATGADHAHPNELRVYRSSTGNSVTHTPPTFVHTATISANFASPAQSFLPTDNPACFSVVVHPQTGDVYVIWLDWSTGLIYAAKSDRNAQVFTQLGSTSAGTFLGIGSDSLTVNNITIQARSMLNVRFNYLSNSIGVAWHAREGTSADVWYAYYDTAAIPPSWVSAQRISRAPASTDQFHPALDYANSGDWLITYFDRRNDSTGRYYEMYGNRISSTGIQRDTTDTRFSTNGDKSDIQKAYLSFGKYLIGEYQDVWFSNGVWISCFPWGQINGNSDIYFTNVTP